MKKEVGSMKREVRSRKFICLFVALRPSSMLVYLGDGFAQTILRASTLMLPH